MDPTIFELIAALGAATAAFFSGMAAQFNRKNNNSCQLLEAQKQLLEAQKQHITCVEQKADKIIHKLDLTLDKLDQVTDFLREIS